MAPRALLCLAVLGLLASSAFAATTFRHQFQYALKPEHLDKRSEIAALWTTLSQTAPDNGKPTLYQFGNDLGIAKKLYTWSGSQNPNVDFAGRLDFPSEDALIAFWKFTYANPKYQDMIKNWVQTAYRAQYITNTCSYPAPGTYYRHSFEYQIKPSAQCSAGASLASAPAGAANVNSNDVQKAVRTWYKLCETAPVKPVACVFGADLGLSKELYPTPNMAFGGSLDFKSEADLEAFWKWAFPQAVYQDLTKNNLLATRIQYTATFK